MFQLHPQTSQEWDKLLLKFPDAHILQTWEWAEAKKQNGWNPLFFAWNNSENDLDALALILRRQISFFGMNFSILYCPKGPVFDYTNLSIAEQIFDDLENYCRKSNAIFLKSDPDILLGLGIPGDEDEVPNPTGKSFVEMLEKRDWKFSQDQIQFRNTVLIDISQNEEALMAAMKQKTRYNIRLADRKGVKIRQGGTNDLPLLYQMYAETAVRDSFVIRHEDYYLTTWQNFLDADMAKILVAEVDEQPVAALILFHFNDIARYMFGMSTELYREMMPNHLLQWEAIRLSKQLSCHTYDLWGAPDVFDDSDSMWGVFRFKQGFNGLTVRHIGAWDFSPRPILYKIYTQILPKLLNILRRRGIAENRRSIQND